MSPHSALQHTVRWCPTRQMYALHLISEPGVATRCIAIATVMLKQHRSSHALQNHPRIQALFGQHHAQVPEDLYLCNAGWEFDGHLCTSCDRKTEGAVWECPMLIAVPPLTTSHHQQGESMNRGY